MPPNKNNGNFYKVLKIQKTYPIKISSTHIGSEGINENTNLPIHGLHPWLFRSLTPFGVVWKFVKGTKILILKGSNLSITCPSWRSTRCNRGLGKLWILIIQTLTGSNF